VLKYTQHFINNMQYTWTSKFIKELSKNLKLANKTQIWEHCMILTYENKDEAVKLYSLLREQLAK
jgi:hypothetical protein